MWGCSGLCSHAMQGLVCAFLSEQHRGVSALGKQRGVCVRGSCCAGIGGGFVPMSSFVLWEGTPLTQLCGKVEAEESRQ